MEQPLLVLARSGLLARQARRLDSRLWVWLVLRESQRPETQASLPLLCFALLQVAMWVSLAQLLRCYVLLAVAAGGQPLSQVAASGRAQAGDGPVHRVLPPEVAAASAVRLEPVAALAQWVHTCLALLARGRVLPGQLRAS